MKTKFLCSFLILVCCEALGGEEYVWKGLASIDKHSIERSAISYINDNLPELKGVEIKLVQINAMYHKSGPTLEAMFLHANSFKPMSENKTMRYADERFPIQFYMEFIEVAFSADGKPSQLNYHEAPLGKTREESLEMFQKHYLFFDI